jgi:gas vesicle protein
VLKHFFKYTFLSSTLFLAACGEPAPAGWNANLDIDCKPQDPVDKFLAAVSTDKFWRTQEYDMGSMLAAATKNLELSKQVLEDSQAQQGQYLQRAQEAARELGLRGSDAREHVRENMDRYKKEVDDIKARIEQTEKALAWIRKCDRAVDGELRKLGIQPVEYDPAKRPM